MQGKENHQDKKTKESRELHQSAKSAQNKGSNQAANPLEEDANKSKTKKKNSPVCPLHGPGHNISLCKFMLAQEIAMK